MIAVNDVRETVLSFLRNSVSLDDFERWLVAKTWNMHLDSDPFAIDLVTDVELALSEYSSDHLTDEEFRIRLLDSINRVVVNVQLIDDFLIAPRALRRTANSFGSYQQVSVLVPA